jgi:hypothetical protein
VIDRLLSNVEDNVPALETITCHATVEANPETEAAAEVVEAEAAEAEAAEAEAAETAAVAKAAAKAAAEVVEAEAAEAEAAETAVKLVAETASESEAETAAKVVSETPEPGSKKKKKAEKKGSILTRSLSAPLRTRSQTPSNETKRWRF